MASKSRFLRRLAKYGLCVSFALCSALGVSAQNRPGNFSTLNTTDTTANSLHVGCAVGSSTCTGGVVAGASTFGGNVTVTTGTNTGLGFVAAQGGGASAFGKADVSADTASVSLRSYASGFNAFTHAGLALAGFSEVWSDTVSGAGPLGLLLGIGTNASVQFATNNLVRWGVNQGGDLTLGPSSHVALSSGTPSIAVAFGTAPAIIGTDYAMKVTVGSSAGTTTGQVAFGHTFTTAPICVVSTDSLTDIITIQSTSTTRLVMTPAANWSGINLWILCNGY